MRTMMRKIETLSRILAVVALAAFGVVLPGCGAESDQPSAAVTAELMARWNAVPADAAFGFQWQSFDEFPHPTFSGGSAQAYQAFADHLVRFYGGGDNFDFVSKNHLFKIHLRYVFDSGQVGIDTTFDALTVDLARTDSISAETRQALQTYSDRIRGPS